MDVILVAAIFIVVVVAWTYIPFIPAMREFQERSDIEPVRVARDSDVDIHHFASGFRRFRDRHLKAPLEASRREHRRQEGRLEDGTDYVVVDGKAERSFAPDSGADEPCRTLVASAGDLSLPGETVFLMEQYAGGSIATGSHAVHRAMLAEASIRLGAGSTSLRWAHAGTVLGADEESRLLGRASADERIELAEGCLFERLNAPAIHFGSPTTVDVPVAKGEPLDPGDIPRVMDTEAGRWLIRRRLELEPRQVVEADLVVTGRAEIGEGCRIAGGIKAHKSVRLGPGVVVEGSVVSGGRIVIEEGCRIHGPVLAEKELSIGTGTVIGSAEVPTTVSARRLKVAPGVVAHGTVWAHEEGRVAPGPGEER